MKHTESMPSAERRQRMIHVRLAAETHRRLRVRAAEEDRSIQDWVNGLIEKELNAAAQDPELVLRPARR